VGRFPERLVSYKRLLVDRSVLQQRLDEAVRREDYEEAAIIRDSMLALEAEESDDE
jgi:protein-arginine kinase activator protein McsA